MIHLRFIKQDGNFLNEGLSIGGDVVWSVYH